MLHVSSNTRQQPKCVLFEITGWQKKEEGPHIVSTSRSTIVYCALLSFYCSFFHCVQLCFSFNFIFRYKHNFWIFTAVQTTKLWNLIIDMFLFTTSEFWPLAVMLIFVLQFVSKCIYYYCYYYYYYCILFLVIYIQFSIRNSVLWLIFSFIWQKYHWWTDGRTEQLDVVVCGEGFVLVGLWEHVAARCSGLWRRICTGGSWRTCGSAM